MLYLRKAQENIMDKKTQSTATVIFTDNPPFNQKGEPEKKEVKPEADSLYGGNPAVMADAIEQMKNVRKLLKDRLKGTKDNAEAIIATTADEKVRLQGSKETKAPALKPYTESVDVKDRAELSRLVEKAKKEKKLFKIGRSMKEGFRYTFLIEGMVKEEAKSEFKVGSTVKIISMAGEPGYTGKVGKITKIDDAGQLHGTWGGLALIPGDDKFELVTVINNETGKIEEKKHVMEDVQEGFGTELLSFEKAKELGKGTKWPVSADKKYFDMYIDKGLQLFVKGEGDKRILTVARKGDVINAYDVMDKLVALEAAMGKMPKMENAPKMEAMPKMEAAPEEHHHDDAKHDEGEYDQEGDMAKSDLQIIADAALELHSMLTDDENLPEWVQAKITLASDYIDTARDYMKAKKDGKDFPEPKEDEEGEEKEAEAEKEPKVELEPLKEAAPGSWGKEVITLQEFATAVEKLGREDIDVFPILKGIAEGTHKAFVKHDGKDITITVLRGDVVEMTLTSKKEEAMAPLKEMEVEKGKVIILVDGKTEHIIKSAYDLYDLYNDFLIDHESGTLPLDEKTLEIVEEIRDNYRDIYARIPRGRHQLDKFEELAIKEEELEEALVEPNKGESEQDYVSRFMGTKRAKKDFPDQKQRLAVAYSKFNAAKGKKEEMEIKETKFFPGEDGDTEAHMFIEEHEIEDFDLTWDDKKGGYVLTWEAKEEMEEMKEYVTEEKHGKEEKKDLKEETKILSSLNEFEPWSGAVSTWELIVEADKVDALDFMLEDLYPEGISSTELNDLLWFESDWVLDMLSIDASKVEAEDGEKAEEPKAKAKPERELIALNDLDEEPVVFDIDELEEGKHAHDKKEKHGGKEEMKESSGSILKEVQDFIAKTVGK